MSDPDSVRNQLEIKVTNGIAPNPILSFDEASLPKYLVENLKGFEKPTPI